MVSPKKAVYTSPTGVPINFSTPHLVTRSSSSGCVMSTTATHSDRHLHFIRLALAQAKQCEAVPTAFSVGCILVTRWPTDDAEVVLATGYSREVPGNTHAEANALTKAHDLSRSDLETIFPTADGATLHIDALLAHTDVYTTMEPCSIRTSGLSSCADALIMARVRKCFIGVGEPDDFVKCEGAQKLMNAGVEVIWVKGLEQECLAMARKKHS